MNQTTKKTNNEQRLYDENLSKLWQIIQSAAPADREKIIEKLDEEIITALRVRKNPYKKPVFMGSKNKMLAFSIINISEKYGQRLAMTSLIGFIYRMLDEYEPECDLISENDPIFAVPFNKKVKIIKRQRPGELLMARIEELARKLQTSDFSVDQTAPDLKNEIYILRAKLIKYTSFWKREDFNLLKEKLVMMRQNSAKTVDYQQINEREIDALEKKLKIKQNFDKERAATLLVDDLDDIAPTKEEAAEIQKTFNKKGGLPEGMTIEDMMKKTATYLLQIENKKKLVDKKKGEQIEIDADIEKNHGIYKQIESDIAELNAQIKDLKVKYVKFLIKSHRISKREAQIESEVLDNVDVERYELNDGDYDALAAETKKEIKIDKTKEEFHIEQQNIIEGFLDSYFRYNPDNHVRCAYKPNYDDPQRTPMDQAADVAEAKYERCVIPPDDTFFRWNRYLENNYECLRQATDDIYCEKCDLEYAIVPLQTFEGKTKKEMMNDFDLFKRKYASEFDSEIFSADFGSWTMMSSWAQNNDVRDYFTEKTEIIKRILQQNEEDNKMGAKLMKDRVQKKKKENEKKSGPHAASLSQYRDALQPNAELEKHGAKHISEIHTQNVIKTKNVPRDTNESTDQEIEVVCHEIRPYISGKNRRRIRGESDQFKFHIPSEELAEGSVNFMNPHEYQKKYMNTLDE